MGESDSDCALESRGFTGSTERSSLAQFVGRINRRREVVASLLAVRRVQI